MSKAISVKCLCGWRGRRSPGECTCYDEYAMYCSCTWGLCPKCGGRVYPLDYWREIKETLKLLAELEGNSRK